MTELEKLQRAKMYMDKLSNGTDPITGSDLPEDTVLNNVRLARCFFYISDILSKVIDNGGAVGRVEKLKLLPFMITEEQKKAVKLSAVPIPISAFVENINEVIDNEIYKKISAAKITAWLLKKGLLQESENEYGNKSKTVTDQSALIGITNTEKISPYGRPYSVNLYDMNAQTFILDNMDAILHEEID